MTDTIDEINEVGPTIPNYNARPIVLVASRNKSSGMWRSPSVR